MQGVSKVCKKQHAAIQYGYICIATDSQTESAFLSQMKMLFITVYIKLCMNSQNHNQM